MKNADICAREFGVNRAPKTGDCVASFHLHKPPIKNCSNVDLIKPIPRAAVPTAIKSTRLTVRIEFNPVPDFGSDRRTQSRAQFFVLIRLKPSETAAPNSETHVCYTESRMEHHTDTATDRFQSTCFPKSVFHFGKQQNPTPLASKDQPSCQDEKSGPNRGPGVPVPVRNQLCRRFVRIKLCTGGDQ
ncbi:LOW QUALITY PROTEIN: uncharacterized protein Dyak_GE28047, partial [Drosophila yakuba]